jgi:hypothetical protein
MRVRLQLAAPDEPQPANYFRSGLVTGTRVRSSVLTNLAGGGAGGGGTSPRTLRPGGGGGGGGGFLSLTGIQLRSG